MTSFAVSEAFGELPVTLRDELIGAFNLIVRNYREHHWEPAELNGGKLCEVAYSILKGFSKGNYPDRASKPRNMVLACQSLESEAPDAPRSVRIQIPRMLIALYEIRNNRNVGHVGADVDPNHMDALCVLQMSKWVMGELVRILHRLDTEQAAEIVESLVERETPLIWEVDGRRRVLASGLSMREKTLLLLHSQEGAAAESDLLNSVDHSNPSVYRRDVLQRLHEDRLVEYDIGSRRVTISPTGIAEVEERVLPSIARAQLDGEPVLRSRVRRRSRSLRPKRGVRGRTTARLP